jgi:hypothetical protein
VPYTFLIDDSDRQRTAEHPGGGIFGMGGVILPTTELAPFERDIDDLVAESFTERVELKWNMPRSAVEKLRKGKTQSGVRERVFQIIAAHDARSVVTLIYDVRGENSAVGRDRMRRYAFEPCLQRLQNHVSVIRDDGPHSVVVDTPPDGPKQLHEVYSHMYRNAASLPSGKKIRSGRECGFASALHISDATQCLGLQAADLTVGCVVSWAKAELTALKDKNSDPKPLAYGRTHMAHWLPVARKGPNDTVLGYGLVVWPKEINHLTLAMKIGLAAIG